MGFKRFEELPCWQRARELCRGVYGLIQEERFRRDFSLKDQIWRAAGSVMDNIAEGFDDGSSNEFIRFLGYSQRSCGELQSQLYKSAGLSIHQPGTVSNHIQTSLFWPKNEAFFWTLYDHIYSS